MPRICTFTQSIKLSFSKEKLKWKAFLNIHSFNVIISAKAMNSKDRKTSLHSKI